MILVPQFKVNNTNTRKTVRNIFKVNDKNTRTTSMTYLICYKLTSLVSLWQEISKNSKNRWKSMKIASIDREVLHIFWTAWGISISGKMWFMIMLKVTKNQGFTLSLEDTFLKKPQGGGEGGVKLTPSRFRVK